MNPDLATTLHAHDMRVERTTEDTFDDMFWSRLDLVISAADTTRTHRYIDEQCVAHYKMLCVTTTRGMDAHAVISIPHRTASYSEGCGASDESAERKVSMMQMWWQGGGCGGCDVTHCDMCAVCCMPCCLCLCSAVPCAVCQCPIRCFPSDSADCIAWSHDAFNTLFMWRVDAYNACVRDGASYVTEMQERSELEALKAVRVEWHNSGVRARGMDA